MEIEIIYTLHTTEKRKLYSFVKSLSVIRTFVKGRFMISFHWQPRALYENQQTRVRTLPGGEVREPGSRLELTSCHQLLLNKNEERERERKKLPILNLTWNIVLQSSFEAHPIKESIEDY